MTLSNENFPVYMNYAINTIPAEDLTPMLIELAALAMFYMNTENDVVTTTKLVTAIKDMMLSDFTYKQIPLHLLIETFHKGSLGELGGTSKFGIRNVNIWLSNIREKHQKLITEEISKKDYLQKTEEERSFRSQQKHNNKFASAYYGKIKHCPMSDAEYDRLTLDKIVERIEAGFDFKTLTPEMIP